MGEPRHLLITGPGRSGSTIVQRILGQIPGVHMAGESGWAARDRAEATCSCGVSAQRCPHWTALAAHLDWSDADWAEARDDAAWAHRHWNFGTVARQPEHARACRYAHRQLALLDAHAHVAGTAWTVDATKYSARALALWRTDPARVRVLWWSRAPADLVRAWGQGGDRREQPQRSTAWVALYDAVLSRQYRRISAEVPLTALTYAQLRDEPTATAAALAAVLGVPDTAVTDALQRSPLAPGHVLTGNRNRHRACTWQPEAPAPPTRATALMRELRDFLEAP